MLWISHRFLSTAALAIPYLAGYAGAALFTYRWLLPIRLTSKDQLHSFLAQETLFASVAVLGFLLPSYFWRHRLANRSWHVLAVGAVYSGLLTFFTCVLLPVPPTAVRLTAFALVAILLGSAIVWLLPAGSRAAHGGLGHSLLEKLPWASSFTIGALLTGASLLASCLDRESLWVVAVVLAWPLWLLNLLTVGWLRLVFCRHVRYSAVLAAATSTAMLAWLALS